MPQLRQNIITGDWVVIAPERARRPSDYFVEPPKEVPEGKDCVFCEGGVASQTKLKKYENKKVYVIPNKFPAFLESKIECSPRTLKTEHNFYNQKSAMGGHDVLVVKKHDDNIYNFSTNTWEELLQMFKKRYLHWREDCNSEYSMAIYNSGQQAGASILHPHAQIFAGDIIPNQVVREIKGSHDYFISNGVCIFCDIVRHEKLQKVRIIEENSKFIAFTFYAARFPYEIWIVPKIHQSHFESEGFATYQILAKTMQKVFVKLGNVLKNPPLNFYIHDSPPSLGETHFFHWHLEITPRISNYGGYELGSGVIIDIQSPEEAAKYLNL